MDARETFDLPIQGIAALQKHGYARTFGLLLFEQGATDPDTRVDGATGVGVRIGSRYFIATAGHNLVGVPDNGLVLVHEDGPAYEPTPFLRRWPEIRDREPNPDVGYIEISPEVAEKSPKEFVPLDQVRPEFKAVGVNVVLVGHPVERIPKELLESHRLINLPAMPVSTYTVELPAGRNQESDFALAVHDTGPDVESGQSVTTPSLLGISGGGVWAFPGPLPSGIWSPSVALLVGLQHRWLRKSRIVLCAQMQHWLAAIERDYPDLRSELRQRDG